MNLEKMDKNDTSIIKYSKTDNVLNDVCSIIDSARDYAFQSVNLALVERNWLKRVQNLIDCFLGVIIEHYYKYLIKKQENGMKMKH